MDMGHIAKLGHIWLYYSQIGLLGWKWPKLGIISYVKWPFLAIYMTWGHHDRIRERNLNIAILWVGRNFWARNFEIYPKIAIFDENPFKNDVSTHMSKNVVFFPKFLQKLIKSEIFFNFSTKVIFAVNLIILARAPSGSEKRSRWKLSQNWSKFLKYRFDSK